MSEDRIIIGGMEFWARSGISEAERAFPQPFRADVEIFYDLRTAGHSDNLADTVNYGAVYTLARKVGENNRHQLLEALAEEMAQAILEKFQAKRVKIRLKKMKPPIPGPVDYVAVEIERER